MATRKIINGNNDSFLQKKSRPVTVFDDRLHALLDDMAETMYAADGVGLAAVQVGVLRRVVVIDTGEGLIELINPKIVESSTDTICKGEGCLSFPREYGLVDRPRWVKVQAQDRNGNFVEYEGEELLARAFCHEIDHLDGIVFKTLASEMLDPDDDDQ